MLEHPTESQCPGTPSAETATADTCIMPACTVHITPVNNIHTHTHNCHMHPNVNTTHEHTHSTIHNANHLNHLLTLHPPPPITHTAHPIHQHSSLAAVTNNLSPLLPHPPPPPLASIAPREKHTTHTSTPPLPPLQLYDLLSPHLLHHYSLLTTVHDPQAPLHSSATMPLPILTTLHRLLSESPHLLSLIPPLPTSRTRPTRAPPCILRRPP